ncbi:TRAP-type C4-dicarboxylate transport system large permease component [Vibrio variabilis]|uniref:TRAP-type C4-dicarboxylate transport system large permease component n=1 Tax=Vibrio variabilis TaxID=990271 RepID=A0ABQ0JGD6_9VIBR|nr:TRAP-type C4-dicarboxylate transport system large permease component [Vibrio variabilis]
MLPIIIIVGLRGGVFTPTEAGVIAAAYVTIISVAYRELKFKDMYEIFLSSIKTTGIVMFIAASAMVSAYAITVARIPNELASLLNSISSNPTVILLIIMVFLLFIGCVMDLVPAILIFAPVLLPVVTGYGIDPVYFGVLMVINLSIGLITPLLDRTLRWFQYFENWHRSCRSRCLAILNGSRSYIDASCGLPANHSLPNPVTRIMRSSYVRF